jgi:AcrR family transcriptional regulator
MARTRAADHDDKRRAILRAAARVFAREGYGIASMAQVAAEAGVSKANLYHYAGGKEALLFDLLDAHLRALRDRLADAEGRDPRDRLRAAVEALLTAYEGADAEHEVQLNAIGALPPDRQDALKEVQRDMVRDMRARVAALAPGLGREALRDVTMSVFAMANWHTQWAGSADARARRRYAALVAALVAGGVPALPPGEIP